MTDWQPDEDQHQMLRSGITLYPSQNKAIDQILTDLIQNVPARFILLADVTGQIVSTRGEQGNVNRIALGSLVAGDLAASQEIARLTGQYQDFQVVLREGNKIHTFILETGPYLALFVQVSNDVPLGWARMIIKNAARDLADVAATPPEETEQSKATAQTNQMLNEEKLPDLFSDALDDLWTE